MISQNIRRFQFDVTLADSSVFSKKYDDYVKMLTDEMRERGYIPVLDLGVHIAVDYDGKVFNYVLTEHGIYVGRKKAWAIDGVAGGKQIPRTTTNKSNASLKK